MSVKTLSAAPLRRVACGGAVMLSLVVLTACAKAPPPAVFTDYATNVQIAQVLAAGCPDVTLNQAGMGAGARDLGVALRAQGYTAEDIAAFPDTIDVGEIRGRAQAYLTANGIDPTDRATVCPVAKREIDAGSPIAAFLTAA
ncbi:DUF5333 family protein [Meridianimarinicoccus roseus]|nr:DUF5333 family protein [Meridianimarinicoccus roseus]